MACATDDVGVRYWCQGRARSPRAEPAGRRRYLVYDQVGGLFNNMRLALEHAAILALALNRTLVLPEAQTDQPDLRRYYSLAELNSGPIRVITAQKFQRASGRGLGAKEVLVHRRVSQLA